MDETRKILKIAKRLDKKSYRKLKQIKDSKELKDAGEHAIISNLESRFHNLNEEAKNLEEKDKDLFILKNRLDLVPGKIEFVKALFEMEDVDKVLNLFNSIEDEIKNV
jgi:hypothetical protein